jgi:hypothetical protein
MRLGTELKFVIHRSAIPDGRRKVELHVRVLSVEAASWNRYGFAVGFTDYALL